MVIYLHGFGSIGSSEKVDRLIQKFGAESVRAPDLPMDPVEVFDIVRKLVIEFGESLTLSSPKSNRLVFVGTSLGGFYANYFGHVFDAPAVIVNPSTNPSERLRQRLGPNKNFQTDEEFLVTVAHLDTLSYMRNYLKTNYQASLVNIFAAKDDEIVPYESVLEAYPFNAFECIVDTGGHRFTEHWDLVIKRIEELRNS